MGAWATIPPCLSDNSQSERRRFPLSFTTLVTGNCPFMGGHYLQAIMCIVSEEKFVVYGTETDINFQITLLLCHFIHPSQPARAICIKASSHIVHMDDIFNDCSSLQSP